MAMKFCRVVQTINTQLPMRKNLQIIPISSTEHALTNLVLKLCETFALNQISGTSHGTRPHSFRIYLVTWVSNAAMVIICKSCGRNIV